MLIGAGPRGTSVLERLFANYAAAASRARSHKVSGKAQSRKAQPPASADLPELHIDVVDPFPAGPGHVWQPGQSRLYLMNTQSFYPTIIPEEPALAPPLAGTSFDRWRMKHREDIAAGRTEGLSEDEAAELKGLESHDFPSRALYGRYLSSTLQELLQAAPKGVTVRFHETEATAVRRGHGDARRFIVELYDGGRLDADDVVLSLGHLESRLNPEQRSFDTAAKDLGLSYFPPTAPADVDWSKIPAGEPVLVRGMGLNFFDVVVQLTEGRGGSFRPSDEGLAYEPSGNEPHIIAASRRGTPYRAKAALDSYYARSVRLRYLTESAVRRFTAGGIKPGFDHDLWPLLHRDALWAYYTTLLSTEPDVIAARDGFLAALEEALHPHAHAVSPWESLVGEVVADYVPAEHRLDLRALAAPLAGKSFASRADLNRAVVEYLDDDARRSALGESDPVKMAILTLHSGRAVLKTVVSDGGITDESWVAGLRGWFESFIEGLASGPPALRAEQLAALARAGVASFVGPDPKFSVDRKTGMFTAASPWVRDAPVAARCLIEALAPANKVAASKSTLMRQLIHDGLVRPKLMMTAEGTPVQTTGLDVVAHPYRAVAANGAVSDGLYVLGLQLSSAQWGTAIAAQALPAAGPAFRSGQRTLRDADEIARSVLGIQTMDAGPSAGAGKAGTTSGPEPR